MHSLESFILETQSTVARSAQQSSMENSPISDYKNDSEQSSTHVVTERGVR